jgi:hypothetical protein
MERAARDGFCVFPALPISIYMQKILLLLSGSWCSTSRGGAAAADEPVDLLKTLYQKRFQLDHCGGAAVLMGSPPLDAVELPH